MTTPTTNMNWTDPTVGASNDTWGDLTNAIWDNLDAHTAGLIYGLTLSAAGSTATFGIAAGAASGMILSTAYTKTTSAWGVGTGQGGLDTGAIANNTWYHVYLIQRTDTGVVDILVSTSASSPTMPTNYTRKRRIGSMKTDGSSQWKKFSQLGDEFLWDAPIADIAGSVAPNENGRFLTLSTPLGVKTTALLTYIYGYTSQGEYVLLTSPDQADTAASSTQYTFAVNVSTVLSSGSISLRTNTSSQIRERVKLASAGPIDGGLSMFTRGWNDTRGRDA